MTEKELVRWRGLRARGRVWFVFTWGILRFGIPWGVGMLLFAYFHVLDMQFHGWARELRALLIVVPPLGVGAGWLEWRKQERRYKEAVRTSGSATV